MTYNTMKNTIYFHNTSDVLMRAVRASELCLECIWMSDGSIEERSTSEHIYEYALDILKKVEKLTFNI